MLGTAWGLGPEVSAKLHLASSIVGVTDEVEFSELILHQNLFLPPAKESLVNPLDADGCLPAPTGPGLGVEMDFDRLEEFRIR